ARAAVRRTAAARRPRPHAHGGPPGRADGRALLGARRDHAPAYPRPRRVAPARQDRAARDSRSAGGAAPRRPHLRDGRTAGASGRPARSRRRAAARPARRRAHPPAGRAADTAGRSARGGMSRLRPLMICAGLVALWQLVVSVFDMPRFILPAPLDVAVAWWQNLGQLLFQAQYTL